MSVEVKVPSLGESVREATVATIHKKEGELVELDEVLAELETDKVTIEVCSPSGGVVKKLFVSEGEDVEIGTILATLDESSDAAAHTAQQQSAATDLSDKSSKEESDATVSGAILSPAARRISSENAVDGSQIAGTGKDGRVTKADALDAVASKAEGGAENAAKTEPSIAGDGMVQERVKMTRMRRTIASRLKEAQNTAAILTTFNEVDMSAVFDIRKRYKEDFISMHGVKLGLMSFFVKASVVALSEVPNANAFIDGDHLIYNKNANIGIAVGTEQGLVVPVLRNAERLSFAGIEKKIVSFANDARSGKLSMSDMKDGTFSITNGGVYGSMLSTPILNPPQSAILGLHNIVKRAVVVDDNIVIRPMMYIALSYDHRIIDGKEGVTLLKRIKELVESPEKLLFGV